MNDLWEPCFLAADVKLVHKLVSSKNFTVYWNTDEELVGSRNEDAILEYLFNGIHRSTVDSGQNENEEGQQHTEHDNQPPRFQYILSPVSTELKLTINKSNEPDMDIPKVCEARCYAYFACKRWLIMYVSDTSDVLRGTSHGNICGEAISRPSKFRRNGQELQSPSRVCETSPNQRKLEYQSSMAFCWYENLGRMLVCGPTLLENNSINSEWSKRATENSVGKGLVC